MDATMMQIIATAGDFISLVAIGLIWYHMVRCDRKQDHIWGQLREHTKALTEIREKLAHVEEWQKIHNNFDSK